MHYGAMGDVAVINIKWVFSTFLVGVEREIR